MLYKLVRCSGWTQNISNKLISNRCNFFTNAKQQQKIRSPEEAQKRGIRSTLYYVGAATVVTVGMSYAAVPLYRMFCQAYSYGGTTATGHDASKIEGMSAVKHRPITIKFNADTASSMRWNFRPQQNEITVFPGETALAFYTAKNPTDSAVIGISTYNVVPFEAGQYFNKIQCFCFEEQQLNPHEQVLYLNFYEFSSFHYFFRRLTCQCSFTSILKSPKIHCWNLSKKSPYRTRSSRRKKD